MISFDLNLILVPLAIILLIVWAVDKWHLRQYRFFAAYKQDQKRAKSALSHAKKSLNTKLKQHGMAYGVDDSALLELSRDKKMPDEVLQSFLLYQQSKVALMNAPPKINPLVKFAGECWWGLILIILLRTWILEPFNIPSSSMVPTLYTGDFILVNKFAYGLRLPITHKKIIDTGHPKNGDVVVFRYPKNPKINYIKRVIGVPNDTVSYQDGVLFVNGVALDVGERNYVMPEKLQATLYPKVIGGQRLSASKRTDLGVKEERVAQYHSEMLGEHTYLVRTLMGSDTASFAPFLAEQSAISTGRMGVNWQITVPEGRYFVMGDNRDRSEDGRFWGFVDEQHLSGKASVVWLHLNGYVPNILRIGKID